MINRHTAMNAWRQEDIDKFLDKYRDSKIDNRYANLYCYNFLRQEMEFYERVPSHFNTAADVVAYLKELQTDQGGCWRFEVEIQDGDAVGWNWIEVGEWYLEYDYYDPTC